MRVCWTGRRASCLLCIRVISKQHVRIPTYPAEVQGKVHAVLSRRRGKIVSEEMNEGTLFFTIGSLLPVVESFGFSDGTFSISHRNPQAHVGRRESAAAVCRLPALRSGPLLGADYGRGARRPRRKGRPRKRRQALHGHGAQAQGSLYQSPHCRRRREAAHAQVELVEVVLR